MTDYIKCIFDSSRFTGVLLTLHVVSVCIDDPQSDCRVIDGVSTVYFLDDVPLDVVEQESQQMLIVVEKEMEKNDFAGVQVSYNNAPFSTVSAAKIESEGDMEREGGLSIGGIFGIIIAIVLVIAIVALVAIFVIRTRREKDQESLNEQRAVPTGGSEPGSIKQINQDEEYESDSDSSDSSVSLSSASSEEYEEAGSGSASVGAPSAVSGDTFPSNVAQATPGGFDDHFSPGDEYSAAEASYDDESEVSLDFRPTPTGGNNRENMQISDGNVSDGYNGGEYTPSTEDYAAEESYDSINYDRQDDNYIDGSGYIPQNYDAKIQSRDTDDYDDEVRSIISSDPPGTSYRDLPHDDDFNDSHERFQMYEGDFSNSQELFQPYESENSKSDGMHDHSDFLFDHHFEDIPSLPRDDNGSFSSSHGSRESRHSIHSRFSSRSQEQNKQDDIRYVVDNGEDCVIEDNIDVDGHNHNQSHPPTSSFDNYQQDVEYYIQDEEYYPQDDEFYQQHSGDDYIGEVNTMDNNRNSIGNFNQRMSEESHQSFRIIPSSNTAFLPPEELDEVSHASSAATMPRSNKSPGSSVGSRGRSPDRETYGGQEESITSIFKSLSEIQTRLASKGKSALPESTLTHNEQAARTNLAKNPYDMYAHQTADNVVGVAWGKEGVVEDGECFL